jgi:enoyl-CoA hydratase/carnithine racemase
MTAQPEIPEALILFEEHEGYAVITFNRVDKLNALSSPMVAELQERLEYCRGRFPVIVITGKGRAFCAGVDLKERNDWVRKGAKIRGDSVRNKWYDTIGTIIRNHPAVIIVAVNGLCLGAGVTLINIADLALMADTAEIGIPQISFGIYPGVAGASMQTRVRRKHAAWQILTANRVSAAQAEDWGIVNRVVPADDLMDEARALAAHVAQFNPTSLDWCKKALDQIPAHITDFSVALDYGRTVTSIIQQQIGRDAVSPPDRQQGSA